MSRARAYAAESARSPFAGNVLRLMGYLAAGQAVYLACTPLLTRIYTPAEFGLFGLLLTAHIAMSTAVCLNYDRAITAVRRDEDAVTVAAGASLIGIGMSVVFALLLLAAISFDVLGYSELPPITALFLGLMLAAQAAVQIVQGWLTRRQAISQIGRATLSMNVVRAAGQVVMGAVGSGWAGLAGGELLGRLAAFAHMSGGKDGRLVTTYGRPRPARIWVALVHYRRFLTVLLPSLMIDSLVPMLVVAGIGQLFGLAAAGQYFLMRRVLEVPIGFMYRAISDAFYGRIAEHARTAPQQVRALMIRVSLPTALAGLVMTIVLVAAAPPLFDLVFGQEWRLAGRLAAIMAPAAAINLAVAPVAHVFNLSRRPHLRYVFTAMHAAGSAAVLVIASVAELSLIATTAALAGTIFASYCALFTCAFIAAGTIEEPSDGPA